MSYDPRIGNRFLNPGIGYGGSCFPKDTKALRELAKSLGYELKTVSAAIEVNEKQQVRLYTKAKANNETFRDKKLAFLGLAFKAGTDDLREASSLKHMPLLLEEGADVYCVDPVAADNFRKRYPEGKNGNGNITYVENAQDALKDADICFIMTEWPEFKALTPADFKANMKTPVVYDGRNLYDPQEMKDAGVTYYCIGR